MLVERVGTGRLIKILGEGGGMVLRALGLFSWLVCVG